MDTQSVVVIAVIIIGVVLIISNLLSLLIRLLEGLAVSLFVFSLVVFAEGSPSEMAFPASLMLLGLSVVLLLFRLGLGKVTGYDAKVKAKKEELRRLANKKGEEFTRKWNRSGKSYPLFNRFGSKIGEVKVGFLGVYDVYIYKDEQGCGFDDSTFEPCEYHGHYVSTSDIRMNRYGDYYLPEEYE